jgi:hypothetical protein
MWMLLLIAIVITTVATWGVAAYVETPRGQTLERPASVTPADIQRLAN